MSIKNQYLEVFTDFENFHFGSTYHHLDLRFENFTMVDLRSKNAKTAKSCEKSKNMVGFSWKSLKPSVVIFTSTSTPLYKGVQMNEVPVTPLA